MVEWLLEEGPADQIVRLAGLVGIGAVQLESQRRNANSIVIARSIG